jgi:hypothetical protein
MSVTAGFFAAGFRFAGAFFAGAFLAIDYHSTGTEVIRRNPIVIAPETATAAEMAVGYCWTNSDPIRTPVIPAATCNTPKMLLLLYQTFFGLSATRHPTQAAQSDADQSQGCVFMT